MSFAAGFAHAVGSSLGKGVIDTDAISNTIKTFSGGVSKVISSSPSHDEPPPSIPSILVHPVNHNTFKRITGHSITPQEIQIYKDQGGDLNELQTWTNYKPKKPVKKVKTSSSLIPRKNGFLEGPLFPLVLLGGAILMYELSQTQGTSVI